MALTFAQTPQGWQDQVRSRALPAIGLSSQSHGPEIDASELIPRYQLNCLEVKEAGLQGAKQIGWRSLMFQQGSPVSALDILSGDGGALEVEGSRDGEVLSMFVQGIKAAEKRAHREKNDYEIRFLEAPGVLFTAVWLAGKSSQNDLIIPLVSVGKLKAFQSVPATEAKRELRAMATKQLKAKQEFERRNSNK